MTDTPLSPERVTEDRFWSKVDKSSDCWNWTASKGRFGYGVFGIGHSKTVLSHRFAWSEVNGPIQEGVCVLHKCDNPSCVRPDHLFLGTVADNNLDKMSKGRCPDRAGEKNNRAKLTQGQVDTMRRLWATGRYSRAQIASTFSITSTYAKRIIDGKRWREVGAQ